MNSNICVDAITMPIYEKPIVILRHNQSGLKIAGFLKRLARI